MDLQRWIVNPILESIYKRKHLAWISVGIVLISVSGANTSTEHTPPPSKLFYSTFIMQVTEPNDDYYNEFFLQDVR